MKNSAVFANSLGGPENRFCELLEFLFTGPERVKCFRTDKVHHVDKQQIIHKREAGS
jgi:predicted ThiF/HesA family dinucleotide-utilizing enzyme